MIKNSMITVIIIALLTLWQFSAYADNSEMDMLVDMLVENGSLTRQQAQTLAQKAKQRATKEAQEKAAEVAKTEQIRTETEKRWKISNNAMQARWDNGLCFETADGNFKTTIGGRIYADTLYVDGQSSLLERLRVPGDFLRRNDEALIRSARINIEGTVYKDFFYKFQYEFSGDLNNKTEVDGLRGAYLGMENIPFIGTLTVGQMKEPFSLEELASHNDTTFLERALPNVFAPGYSWGIQANNNWLDKRVTFAIGGFRNSDHSGTMASGNEWCLTTRATCLPWYEGQGKLAHLGGSYSYRLPESGGWNNTNNQVRLRQRPELYTREFIVDTGNITINTENLLGLEGAFVYGPFSIQGEYMQAWLNGPSGQLTKSAPLFGAYGYISYILTGEHREYDKSSGEFRSVVPKNIFSFKDRTWGAWELAMRCSYLNLDDKSLGISGGQVTDTTFGVNWYLNPNMRIMFNWVHSDRPGYGSLNGIQTRAQVNFD